MIKAREMGLGFTEALDLQKKRWIAAAITAAASIGTAIYNNVSKKKAARKARKESMQDVADERAWQETMTDKQNDWNLNQWNREADFARENQSHQEQYNDPASQRDRLQSAGYSPMSAQGYESPNIATPSTSAASVPDTSLPQVYNEQGYIEGVADAYLQWRAQDLQQKALTVQSAKIEEETKTLQFQRMKEGLMLGREFEFMGLRIELAKAQTHLTEQEAQVQAEEITRIRVELKQMQQFMAESGARMRRMAIQNACDEIHADNDVRELANKIWLNQKIGYNIRQDTLNKFDEHLINQRIAREQDRAYRYARAGEYSDFSLSVKKGMDVVNSIFEPLLTVSRIGMYKSLSKGGAKPVRNYMEIMRNSSANPPF